ncbi:hypothetical protein MHYP_G00064690 [Metynnis hypsauchen]
MLWLLQRRKTLIIAVAQSMALDPNATTQRPEIAFSASVGDKRRAEEQPRSTSAAANKTDSSSLARQRQHKHPLRLCICKSRPPHIYLFIYCFQWWRLESTNIKRTPFRGC